MPLALVGLSHHTAPVEVRERFAFSDREARTALGRLREEAGVEEAVLLSTCNRTEVYLYPALGSLEPVERILARPGAVLRGPLGDYLYRRSGPAVVRHLFRVAAGLDSLVLGEAEIQGQVREAYQRSGEEADPPMAGPVLHRLFQTALAVGGRVREETSLNEGAGSVASVAVELARKIFASVAGKRVLVLGAGETSERVVEALLRQGVENITVANRTYERAEHLAGRLQGRVVGLDEITGALSSADVVVASTAAPHPLITPAVVMEAFPTGGPPHPLLMIDIAIPRDVDPEVGTADNVFLYNVDDLRRILDQNLDRRQGAVARAEAIVGAVARDFQAWYEGLRVVPAIRALREDADRTRAEELERLVGGMAHWTEADRKAVEAFSRRLLNKWLHEPTVRLREGAADGRGREVLAAARLLLGLDAGGVERPDPGREPGEGDDDNDDRRGERSA